MEAQEIWAARKAVDRRGQTRWSGPAWRMLPDLNRRSVPREVERSFSTSKLVRRKQHSTGCGWPRNPAGRWHSRCPGHRHKIGLWTHCRRSSARGRQGLCQTTDAFGERPHGRCSNVHGRGGCVGIRPRQRRTLCDQSGGIGGRERRHDLQHVG